MLSTYLNYQLYTNNVSRSLQQVAAEPLVKREQAYYQANIGKVKSVDDFIGNYRLFSYAMKASGLENMTYAKAFMKKVLTSDLSKATSFVNQLTDTRFKAFAQNFSFAAGGAVANTATAQSSTQQENTVSLYTAKTGAGSLDGVTETLYYEDHIGKVKNATDISSDSRLYSYVMTAYGLDSTALSKGTLASTTTAQNALEAVLESDSSDPNSTANLMASGQVSTSVLPSYAQSAAKTDETSAAYTKLYGRTTDVIYYEDTIGSVRSVDSFLADPKLVAVAETAYGVDGSAYSTDDLKKILTSDLSNPMSVANQLGPAVKAFAQAFNFSTSSSTNPFAQMAQDFNFDSHGAVASQRTVQSALNLKAIETAYIQRAGTAPVAAAAAKTESTYYESAMATVKSLDDLLSDKRLVSYITKSFGIDGDNPTTATLRSVLTSDLGNAQSAASKLGSAYRNLAAAFNFTTTGRVGRDVSQQAETTKNAQIMSDNYLEQTMEDEAGDQNAGVKLALYFQRKAPAITSVYSILADSALLKVVQTALNIPANSSGQDIDVQATQLKNRVKIADFQNPTKLKRFLSQFANLYDINKASSSGSDITSLFGTGKN